jgi:hypothetical protein
MHTGGGVRGGMKQYSLPRQIFEKLANKNAKKKNRWTPPGNFS